MIIRSSADLLTMETSGDERMRHRLSDIIEASNRGVSMVKQLLTFSRDQTLLPRLVNLTVNPASVR